MTAHSADDQRTSGSLNRNVKVAIGKSCQGHIRMSEDFMYPWENEPIQAFL